MHNWKCWRRKFSWQLFFITITEKTIICFIRLLGWLIVWLESSCSSEKEKFRKYGNAACCAWEEMFLLGFFDSRHRFGTLDEKFALRFSFIRIAKDQTVLNLRKLNIFVDSADTFLTGELSFYVLRLLYIRFFNVERNTSEILSFKWIVKVEFKPIVNLKNESYSVTK